MAPRFVLPAYIDSTMISTFRGCRQKFYNEYGLGLRPEATSIDLHAGAVFSATLERYYREVFLHNQLNDIALGRAYATFTEEWGDFTIINPKHPKTPENMWAAVESYLATYPARTDLCQPYFSNGVPSFEFSFAIPLDFPGFPRHPSGDPWVYVGRFDLFGKWNGLPVVRDEKTAQRLESNWSEKWDLRSQFLGYCWALQMSGVKCTTAIIRGVIITLKEIRQVEAVKTYPQFLIDRWFEQLRRDLIALRACFDSGYWDYNLADTCTAYSHCPFIPLCSSPKPELWYPSYAERRWNPLARNPVASAPTTISASFARRGNIPDKFLHLLPDYNIDSTGELVAKT
jgi:hypothetical protein